MWADKSSWSGEERHFFDTVVNVVLGGGEIVVSFVSELTEMSSPLVIVL